MLALKHLTGKTKDENGASSVEFAIILPVLILILFGILEFGLVYRDYLAITHAAREGARLASVGDYSEAEIIQRSYPVTPSTVSVSYLSSDGMARHGYPVEVEVRYNRPLNIPLFPKSIIHLTSRARMRVEY